VEENKNDDAEEKQNEIIEILDKPDERKQKSCYEYQLNTI
jgi:hypothetical protein